MATADKVALIVGGCGIVGSGVVLSFLRDGWKVVTMSRSQERIQKLTKLVPEELKDQLCIKEIGIDDLASTEKLRDSIVKDYGKIDHVVACINAVSWGKPLTDRTCEDVLANVENTIRPHFLLMKVFVPYLNEIEGTSYTLISDCTGEEQFVAELSMASVACASVIGLSIALMTQYADAKVAVSDLRLGMLIYTRAGEKIYIPFEMPPLYHDEVGDVAVAMAKTKSRSVLKIRTRQEYETILEDLKKKSCSK